MKVTVWDRTNKTYTDYTGVTFISNIGEGNADNGFKLKFKDSRKKDITFDRDNFDLDFIHTEG